MIQLTLLNRHRGYVKLDDYLLHFLCHMTSDVKFWHMLFFSLLHCLRVLSTKIFKSFILGSKRTLTFKQRSIFFCNKKKVGLK